MCFHGLRNGPFVHTRASDNQDRVGLKPAMSTPEGREIPHMRPLPKAVAPPNFRHCSDVAEERVLPEASVKAGGFEREGAGPFSFHIPNFRVGVLIAEEPDAHAGLSQAGNMAQKRRM